MTSHIFHFIKKNERFFIPSPLWQHSWTISLLMDYNMGQAILVHHRHLSIDSWAQCISQYYHCNSQNIVGLEAAGLFILCILRQSQTSLPSLLLERKGWMHVRREGISKELGENLGSKIKVLNMTVPSCVWDSTS